MAELKHYPLPLLWREIFENLQPGDKGLPFSTVIDLVLYHPIYGYYQKNKPRVGKSPTTDFYTATTLGPIFGKMVLTATASWLKHHQCDCDSFYEIGAEKNQSLYDILKNDNTSYTHPFINHKTICLNEPIEAHDPNSSIIAFSNELLDAQPFDQYRIINQKWIKWGLFWNDKGLYEGPMANEDTVITKNWPTHLPNGYTIDWPIGAINCLSKITQDTNIQSIAFLDYGKFQEDIFENYPHGTSRAYYKHQQSNHLWNHLGEQDITHHLIWEPLIDTLAQKSFTQIEVLTQEKFFIQYAYPYIEALLQSNVHPLNPERRALQALIHPAHFGQKFQVLLAIRKLSKQL